MDFYLPINKPRQFREGLTRAMQQQHLSSMGSFFLVLCAYAFSQCGSGGKRSSVPIHMLMCILRVAKN